MKDTIKKLVEAWGPSGYEHEVRALIREEVEGLADEIRVDPLGNLICRMGSGGTKIMIAAHMDEIGLMVTHVDDDGFLRFAPIGGLMPKALFANRVRFENGTLGTISADGTEWAKAPALDDCYIDVSTGANTDAGVGVGDPAAFWREMEVRGNRAIAKSMDDRIGCVVGIEAMRKLKRTKHEVYFVFTVQEEVGLRGAMTSAYTVKPDIGVGIDTTLCCDTPGVPETERVTRQGDGVAITVMDSSVIASYDLVQQFEAIAKKNRIPHQRSILGRGGTDTAALQKAGSGAKAITISVGTRYIHTVTEMVHRTDLEAARNLLAAFLAAA